MEGAALVVVASVVEVQEVVVTEVAVWAPVA